MWWWGRAPLSPFQICFVYGKIKKYIYERPLYDIDFSIIYVRSTGTRVPCSYCEAQVRILRSLALFLLRITFLRGVDFFFRCIYFPSEKVCTIMCYSPVRTYAARRRVDPTKRQSLEWRAPARSTGAAAAVLAYVNKSSCSSSLSFLVWSRCCSVIQVLKSFVHFTFSHRKYP